MFHKGELSPELCQNHGLKRRMRGQGRQTAKTILCFEMTEPIHLLIGWFLFIFTLSSFASFIVFLLHD